MGPIGAALLPLLMLLGAATAAHRHDKPAAKVPAAGICWTRNQVWLGKVGSPEKAAAASAAEIQMSRDRIGEELRDVIKSAASAARAAPAVPRCVFTNAPRDELERACAAAGHPGLFDVVLADGWAARSPANRSAVAAVLGRGERVPHKMGSRLGRLLNLGAAPFELALYVDDDTHFCRGAPLAATLAALHGRRHAYDVRGRAFDHLQDAARCAWKQVRENFTAALDIGCHDAVARSPGARQLCDGAQGGAFAVARGARSRSFARAWFDAYVEYWSPRSGGRALSNFGGDQGPLIKLMGDRCADGAGERDWSFGSLPVTLNVRDVDAASNASVAANPCAQPLFGPILMIHQKKYVHGSTPPALDAICAAANRPVGAGGLVFLGRADVPPEPRCAWMEARARPGGAPG